MPAFTLEFLTPIREALFTALATNRLDDFRRILAEQTTTPEFLPSLLSTKFAESYFIETLSNRLYEGTVNEQTNEEAPVIYFEAIINLLDLLEQQRLRDTDGRFKLGKLLLCLARLGRVYSTVLPPETMGTRDYWQLCEKLLHLKPKLFQLSTGHFALHYFIGGNNLTLFQRLYNQIPDKKLLEILGKQDNIHDVRQAGPLLHFAVRQKSVRPETLQGLLEFAELGLESTWHGITPLWFAAKNDELEKLIVLLEAGASLSAFNEVEDRIFLGPISFTPISIAARCRNWSIVKTIATRKSSSSEDAEGYNTALFFLIYFLFQAKSRCDEREIILLTEVFHSLIEGISNLNYTSFALKEREDYRYTPGHLLLLINDQALLEKYFTKASVEIINVADLQSSSLLTFAMAHDVNLDTFQWLLTKLIERGIDIDYSTNSCTALWTAAATGSHEKVTALLNKGAKTSVYITSPIPSGSPWLITEHITPIMIAARNSHWKVVQAIAEHSPSSENDAEKYNEALSEVVEALISAKLTDKPELFELLKSIASLLIEKISCFKPITHRRIYFTGHFLIHLNEPTLLTPYLAKLTDSLINYQVHPEAPTLLIYAAINDEITVDTFRALLSKHAIIQFEKPLGLKTTLELLVDNIKNETVGSDKYNRYLAKADLLIRVMKNRHLLKFIRTESYTTTPEPIIHLLTPATTLKNTLDRLTIALEHYIAGGIGRTHRTWAREILTRIERCEIDSLADIKSVLPSDINHEGHFYLNIVRYFFPKSEDRVTAAGAGDGAESVTRGRTRTIISALAAGSSIAATANSGGEEDEETDDESENEDTTATQRSAPPAPDIELQVLSQQPPPIAYGPSTRGS